MAESQRVGQATSPSSPRELPHPLTFFVSPQERAQVLALLGGRHKDRRVALLRALGIETGGGRS
ncbi:MAG: hypothetical protein ACYTF7_09790 [Planctomycetota bacterium]